MTASTSRLAYHDCFDILDRAMADDIGTRIKFSAYGDASHFRMRIHRARVIDRDENRRLYDDDHHMWGKSIYDILKVTVDKESDDIWWLYVKKFDTSNFVVEDLSSLEENTDG